MLDEKWKLEFEIKARKSDRIWYIVELITLVGLGSLISLMVIYFYDS